jgi:hypothetical protein
VSPEEFAALPAVRKAVENYARASVAGDLGDLAAEAEHLLKAMDAAGGGESIYTAAALGMARDGRGRPFLRPEQVSAYTLALESVRQHLTDQLEPLRSVMKRVIRMDPLKGTPGTRLKLIPRRQLTLRLADSWKKATGKKATVTKNAAGADQDFSGAFTDAYLFACRDLPDDIRPTAATIAADLRALGREGLL